MKILLNIARFILSIVFITSGFVKAVDPIGTQYKLQDYAIAMGLGEYLPDWVTLGGSIALIFVEFTLGVLLLFAINRRIISKILLFVMVVMTALTVWIYISDPVSDCGCFGDAIVLTNGQTLVKNLILLTAAILVAWKPLLMPRFISLKNQWLVFNISSFFILGISAYALYFLPIIDFRPYHVGANIPAGMKIPEGAEQPEFETTFIMEKDGKQEEFTLDNYPDSTWTFIDSKTKVLKHGYEPPIHDFNIIDTQSGDDITDMILQDPGYTFLLISPHLEDADDGCCGKIDDTYEFAHEHKIPFYCLTASTDKGIAHWKDITGAEYPFCNVDETTLKTIIRSNPGLLLIKKGTIIAKWSHNRLPDDKELGSYVTKNEERKMYNE